MTGNELVQTLQPRPDQKVLQVISPPEASPIMFALTLPGHPRHTAVEWYGTVDLAKFESAEAMIIHASNLRSRPHLGTWVTGQLMIENMEVLLRAANIVYQESLVTDHPITPAEAGQIALSGIPILIPA